MSGKFSTPDIPLVSMQAQYSLIDSRPEHGLAALCEAHRVGLLCYGSVAGGFLSDRWLGARSRSARSPIGRSRNTSSSSTNSAAGRCFRSSGCAAPGRRPAWASMWRPSPARGSHADPASPPSSSARRRARIWRERRGIAAIRLTPADHAEIAAITTRRLGPGGDVYELERDRGGRHGSIMKYNLSAERV